jgi:hypothetical protein
MGGGALLQCSTVGDWRQIQARIRKAKSSPNAQAKLSELYLRTRDAMVAWELAAVAEKAGQAEEAAKWYGTALERFRRPDWKKKAEEALARLGVAAPPVAEVEEPAEVAEGNAGEGSPEDLSMERAESAVGEITSEMLVNEEGPRELMRAEMPAGLPQGDALRKRRRRGRRGGRGRRRKGAPSPALPARSFAEPTEISRGREKAGQPVTEMAEPGEPADAEDMKPVPAPEMPPLSRRAAPQLPSERMAHGRAGDPALASRMAQLESMLRRLLGSPLHRLDEIDEAPAGPGVFLLTDSDQITSYYVEACKTLRVGLNNLLRGGRSTRGPRGSHGGDSGIKSKLAEHLEITDAKVSQYLKDHCVVRWIQLEEDAPHLAHFAIGVLRTPLNAE